MSVCNVTENMPTFAEKKLVNSSSHDALLHFQVALKFYFSLNLFDKSQILNLNYLNLACDFKFYARKLPIFMVSIVVIYSSSHRNL